ncbi:Cytochrome P450 [Rhynchospora pubera]|uniref:Cytochrome P450 n=1 Tax=Rhynchospora pubera TaxID=906938 RepID=A0AAV8CFN9_9POAL|nr:Cytochrome P450 [Rhynchospora pubera]
MEGHLILVLVSVLVILIPQLMKVLLILAWRPYVVTIKYRKQGIVGPKYKFLYGCFKEVLSLKSSAEEIPMDINSHDITPRIFPHFLKWMSVYGRIYLFWFGPYPYIFLSDMELAKNVLLDKSGFYHKPAAPQAIKDLIGKSLVLIDGPDWVRHRSIVKPAFAIDKLKAMTKQIAECAKFMMDRWENQIIQEKERRLEIEILRQFQEVTADTISRTAFGVGYMKGKEAFLAQKKLQDIAYASIFRVQIPGFKYLPTNENRNRWRLEKIMRTNLMDIIQERMKSTDGGYGNDLLGLMLHACSTDRKENTNYMSIDELIDECKSIFFGGHDSTSLLLTWTMFYLSTNQDWQERLREEVLRECGKEVPNADMLSKLKFVNLVLMEALRLYGPFNLLARTATRNGNLGNIKLLKGTCVVIPTAILHRDKEVWGQDADKFNPLRFENGLSKAANHPNAFAPFSLGPRTCIGQTFAMLEAKTVIAMILQRFSFSISPNYVHEPTELITLFPASGLQVVMKPLQA